MADPILPDFYRAQSVFAGRSGLPEDVYVNSWCFRDDTDLGVNAAATTIADQLFKFYNDVHPGASAALKTWMTGRTLTGAMTVKVYNLGQSPPRTPIELSRPITGFSTGQAFPSEVAVCLSYYATRNLPRQRGRIYLGPLAINADGGLTAQPARPAAGLRTALAAAGAWLAAEGIGGVNWHVLSGADGVAREITGGWVDDAFDTQRRRGEGPTVRTTWGAPPS